LKGTLAGHFLVRRVAEPIVEHGSHVVPERRPEELGCRDGEEQDADRDGFFALSDVAFLACVLQALRRRGFCAFAGH
jgi:hypothetical protein